MTSPPPSNADGLTFTAYPGDGAVLLAFDLDQSYQADLAGFAVEYRDPDGHTYPVLNRLSFAEPITSATTPEQRRFHPTSEAPLQKFHWIHFPADVKQGDFTYTATAMLFKAGSETDLEAGPSAEATVRLMPDAPSPFQLGFSRGYISSQAYADHFHNAPIEPNPASFDFDTGPYQAQYHWLGFHARFLVFDFLSQALADPAHSLDVFAYDLDEPDIIHQLGQLGTRLRLYLDDSASHLTATAQEPHAHQWLQGQGAEVRLGHFSRFSHNKVFILKRDQAPIKVLAGSANFSVRGLYVQSNNIFSFDDPATAALYEQAFSQAWNDPHHFSGSPLAAGWHDCGGSNGLPAYSLCFSPHRNSAVSLDRVTAAVTNAKSSVLFAIMEIGSGTGPLLKVIRALPARPELYAFGVTQRLDGALKAAKSGDPTNAHFIPFDYLSANVPAPFHKEWSGGQGEVIHHKFVVTDFNTTTPQVFAGSSNLAAGGEHQNGDNLVCFTEPQIATKYAIEATKLIDHYRFRTVMHKATHHQPLQLNPRSAKWALPYYTPDNPKHHERTLLAHPTTH